MQDRVEVPLVIAPKATLGVVRLQVRPVDGETPAVRETAPLKPLRPETVIVEVPAEPAETATLAGFAVTLKS